MLLINRFSSTMCFWLYTTKFTIDWNKPAAVCMFLKFKVKELKWLGLTEVLMGAVEDLIW